MSIFLVILLSVILLNVILPNVILQNFIMPNDILPNVILQNALSLSLHFASFYCIVMLFCLLLVLVGSFALRQPSCHE